MTINQFGGIFGRNPTFNDVTIEDDLTAKTLTVTGAAAVDSLDLPNAADWSYITNNTPIGGLRFGTQDAAGVFSNQVEISAWGGYVKLNANVPITGNLVISTSGNGIDFSATSGTGTSELFDDYEEGTWTPTIAAGSGTFTTVSAAGRYTKTGRMVIAQLRIFLTDSTGGSGWINISNFPFANSQASYAVAYGESPSGQMIRGTIGASSVNLFEYDNTDPVVNGNYSVTLIYEAT